MFDPLSLVQALYFVREVIDVLVLNARAGVARYLHGRSVLCERFRQLISHLVPFRVRSRSHVAAGALSGRVDCCLCALSEFRSEQQRQLVWQSMSIFFALFSTAALGWQWRQRSCGGRTVSEYVNVLLASWFAAAPVPLVVAAFAAPKFASPLGALVSGDRPPDRPTQKSQTPK